MATTQHIVVDIRSVYGRETIYPVCKAARTFARIANTVTLTRFVLGEIEGLGYEIRVQPHPSTLVVSRRQPEEDDDGPYDPTRAGGLYEELT